MTGTHQKLPQVLKSIAALTLNFKPGKLDDIRKAADILSDAVISEDSELYTMYSAVHEMTINYINKILSQEAEDIEPVNDGIILMRSIARSDHSGNDFVFVEKDIESVVDNLKIVEAEEKTAADIRVISKKLKKIAAMTMSLDPVDNEVFCKAAEMLSGLSFDDNHELFDLFSAVRDMTCSYLQKLWVHEADDVEAAKDGIVLLRAIARSVESGNDFVFGEKDLAGVFNNLETIIKESADTDQPATETLIINIQPLITSARSISGDDIPELGNILNALEEFESDLDEEIVPDVLALSKGLRDFIEKLILGEYSDASVVPDCLELLKAMLKSHAKGEVFTFGIEEMFEKLGCETEANDTEPESDPSKSETEDNFESLDISQPVKYLSDDDVDILGDFIIEAKENLESIEINLIDLEQSPEDTEIINAIFRPFHTIKGVSGFLNLRKINALSHSTENLLDSSRQGNFIIDNEITDIILKAVDALKSLIDRVEKGLNEGKTADDNDIKISGLIQQIEKTNKKRNGTEPDVQPVGEILVEQGALETDDLSQALKVQTEQPGAKLGEILVKEKQVESKDVISALRSQKRQRKQAAPQVKVDTNKLDNLVDLTGELVIAQSMLRQRNSVTSATDQKLLQNLNQLGQIVSNIQKIAMSMRMVPINATFQKMVRLVRDLSKSCKKKVILEMIGEDTEIDRNVVEALYEPMVHMIRNSIDHGLETEEERLAAGKSAKGMVTLRAYHKGGNIVIEISDNGKGLNVINILEKAISSGLITGEEDLSDAEIFQLIMEPGFSTAAEITDISGRGVGMDVVKKAITELSGKIDIHSVEGKGSTFTISLPLTLAIIEGMLVRVGQEKFIIPTMAILESFRPSKEDYYTVEQKGEMFMFRGNLIPVVRLNRICNVKMDSKHIWENIVVVVENKDDQRGILIDELLGKEEFVIKNLGETLKGIKGLAGGAILGDGRIGLIIDISGIFSVANAF